ncbi:polyamine-modulated factor 1-binding protein 1 isoform X5 [Mauremys mutica]|uniref:polyamine-modulated factor 1-binding protein 1 isoform X5 n=1 Tax=Mauremys mutica TaxID=74926 RepID=UPI001D166F6B|nr:polyamine-modulated factor 1-binding protein 1 isoform X5 [Mauremys mutica]
MRKMLHPYWGTNLLLNAKYRPDACNFERPSPRKPPRPATLTVDWTDIAVGGGVVVRTHREWQRGLSVKSWAGRGSGGRVRTAELGPASSMERLGRSAARAGAAPEVDDDDEREADAHDPCCSFEMKQLFGEFHMLYQERLRQLEIMDDTQEEVLRMKVRLLQSYVMDLSDQNSVLVQTMEELERESEWKVATLEAELQEYVARVTEHKQENCTLQITKANLQKEISRPFLAQRPVPTEHLSGSTAAQITVTPPQQMMEQEELRVQLASKEQLIHQVNVHLREANHSQEKSKAEILEKEAKIRELQEIITDLHHEISLKDLEAVNQLEENHLLETTVQSLRQMLDAQEQRIYQLQTKQTERQAELEQKCSRIQQLEQDLEASGRLQEESQRQLGECNARLVQVAGENEALRGHRLEQMLEIEKLMSSLRTWEKASGSLSFEMPARPWEEQAELQQRLADVQDELRKKETAVHRLQAELRDANLLAQETKNQLAEVEVVTMRSKYSMAQKEMSQQHQTIRALEEKQAHLQAHCHHLEEETGFLHARLEAQGLALENEQTLVTSQVSSAGTGRKDEHSCSLQQGHLRHKEEQVAPLTSKLLKAKAEAQAAEQRARRWEDTIGQLKDDLAASQVSQEAAESRAQRKEEQLQGLQRKRQSLHQELKMVQSEAAQLEALLSTSQLESCSLKKELRRRDEELQCLQEQLRDSREALPGARQGKEAIQKESETQLLQRDQLVEQQKADLVAAREELSRCAGQLAELRAAQQQQAGELAVLRERHKTTQQEVCSRDQTIGKLRGDLKSAEEQLVRAKDEGKERAAEGSGLKGKLHQLQDDIRSLQEICGERAQAMAEQTCCIQQLQHEQEICISQSQQQVMLVEQLQGELTTRERAHQTELEQLRAKLQHLQQELDVCKGKNQDNLSHLQQRESTMERQSSHLEFLLQQCQTLKEEVFYYEEVVQKQERELCLQQEQLQEAQEHLAMAKSKSSSTESSLDLYKKKYQAALNRAGELEGKVQSLEEQLRDMSSQMWECDDTINLCSKQLVLQQEMTGRRNQAAVEQLTQELHAMQEELSRSLQHTHQHEQSIQALREQLAASQTKCLEAEETLVHVQTEFASYTATHSHSNASYESQTTMAENLQQQLSQADEARAKHSQRAEEYRCLVQDLKLELVRVAEQKNSSMKALGTLELEVQSLRQDTAAEVEQKQLEVAKLQQLIQQLECKLRESRRLCAQKEQIMQRRDEQLRQAQAAMRQARGALQEKGLELEKQRAEARSLAARLQQAQQEREQSQATSDSLQEELQLLRQSLQDSQRQQQAAAQELVQQEERLLLAQSSLQSTQEQLSERMAEVVRLEQASRRLEGERQALQEQLSRSTDEVEQSRKLLERLTVELGQWKQRHQVAVQQGMQHQHSMAKMELKLGSSQEQAKALQQQLQEQESTQRALREELSQLQGRDEELQRQLQGAQERERVLASEREELQRELHSSEQAATRQESALAQLQAELGAAQARQRQSTRMLTAAEETIQALTLRTASSQETQREALEKLSETAQDMAALRAELVRGQAREAQLEEETAACEERMRQLNGELKKLQGFQQQSEQKARSFAEQLGERSGQVQHWQRRSQEKAQALAQREEDLVVFKVELASLKEKLHGAAEEAEALRSSLGAARSDSRRLHHESELVLANVSQWVKEQKQANDKLGHKIREQIKHIAQLTGEKDHLQEVLARLQQENRHLKGEVAERRIECERLKALQGSSLDTRAVLGQPWPLLLGEE